MNLQKHERDTLRALSKRWPEMRFRIVPAGRHPQLVAQCDHIVVKLAISSSPACADHVPQLALQQLRRSFRLRGIELPTTADATVRRRH